MDNLIYPDTQPKVCESLGQDTILDQLKRQQRIHTQRLNDTEAALKALEENPKILEVLELINKARR